MSTSLNSGEHVACCSLLSVSPAHRPLRGPQPAACLPICKLPPTGSPDTVFLNFKANCITISQIYILYDDDDIQCIYSICSLLLFFELKIGLLRKALK